MKRSICYRTREPAKATGLTATEKQKEKVEREKSSERRVKEREL